MLKRSLVCLIIITLLVGIFSVPLYADQKVELYDSVAVAKILTKTDVFQLQAKAGILMDSATGTVLVESKSHDKLQIASVTKVMSMLLFMEAIDSGRLKFDDIVTISDNSRRMGGSQVYLEAGEQFPVKELMKAIAVESANDATVALAEQVAGSEEAFVAKMNERAKQLGMKDTNFMDTTGLTDDNHYSSAYDVAVVSRELITKHPKIFDFTSIWMTKFRPDGNKAQMSLNNTNKLIRHYEGVVNGLKTGFTKRSGYCLSLTGKKNNLQLIAVVLGEPDTNTRFAEARKLIDYGFANFETVKVNSKDEILQEVPIQKGISNGVNAIFEEDVNLLLKKGEKGVIEKELKLDENVQAPVKTGQRLGEVIFKCGGEQVGKAPVVAQCDVNKASFTNIFFKMVTRWFNVGRP